MAETTAGIRDRIFVYRKQNVETQRHDHTHAFTKQKSEPVGHIASLGEAKGLDSTEKSMPIYSENLHDGLRFSQYMLAGSVAGMVEHLAMFPVDTLKTRMQMVGDACGSAHNLLGRSFISILKTEGTLGFYRGIGAMALGAGPAHAVYFSVYEVAKQRLGGDLPGHHPLVHSVSGILATVTSDAVFTPMDVVKQRLQLPGNTYRGLIDCVQKLIRDEGMKAFYSSYKTTVVMNAPYTATHFATYEDGLMNCWPDRTKEENLFVHLFAGGAAGASASAVTTPLDVVKTRLQCQGVNGAERFEGSSIQSVIRNIVKKEGPKALVRGIKPRVLFHTPAAAICWSTYEAGKTFLQNIDGLQRGPQNL